MLTRKAFLVAICLTFSLACTDCRNNEQRDKSSARDVLPSGEIISKTSWVTGEEPDGILNCQFYFQSSSSSSVENMGPAVEGAGTDILETPKLIFHQGESVVILVGHYIFRRSLPFGKANWYQTTTKPDADAAVYLRSFIAQGDSSVPKRSSFEVEHGFFQTAVVQALDYAFESFDSLQNRLVTRRTSNDERFPKLLVYGPALYGDHWKFDLEQTRTINSIQPPGDPQLVVELSIVTYPGTFQSIALNNNRESALALAGALEVFHQSLSLSATEWRSFDYTLTIPTGATLQQRFETMFAFWDPEPNYFSIVWKGHELSGSPDLRTLTTDVWTNIDASGYQGALNELVFFRVVRAK